MLKYPAQFLSEAKGGFTVTFRDIPEAITQGDDLIEAHAMAIDALVTAMRFYIDSNRAVPAPSETRDGDVLVKLPEEITEKLKIENKFKLA